MRRPLTSLALALAVAAFRAPALADPLPDGDAAVRIVLDVGMSWPADLADLAAVVAGGRSADWTPVPGAPRTAPDADPWRDRIALQAADGRRIACTRVGRATLTRLAEAVDSGAFAGRYLTPGFAHPEVNSLPVWRVAPADAAAFLTCDLLLPMASGADPGKSPFLSAAFALVASGPLTDAATDTATGAPGAGLVGLQASTSTVGNPRTGVIGLQGFQGPGPDGAPRWSVTLWSWMRAPGS
ncbi:MAG TPA: hypothetical protein PKD10_00860 [Paracoccaceae bacterium]|nr:hypothetical protein [Paracoccaceae bacterium]